MRNKIRILSVFLCFILTLTTATPLFASPVTGGIKSYTVPADITQYAKREYKKHVQSLIRVDELEDSSYSLGHPFSLFNIEFNTKSCCFPLINRNTGRIAGIFEVYKDSDEIVANLSKSFSDQLMEILSTPKEYILITDGNTIIAYDGIDHSTIFSINPYGEESNLSSKLDNNLYNNLSSITSTKITELLEDKPSELQSIFNVVGPTSYKTLGVAGVSQGGHPWCWAATTAAIINYYKGKSLSARTVANYAFP